MKSEIHSETACLPSCSCTDRNISDLGKRFVAPSQETILMLTSKIGIFKVLITFLQKMREIRYVFIFV